MPARKSTVNTVYVPIGTIAMPPVLAERVKILAKTSGGMTAVVRAALLATYGADLLPPETRAALGADASPVDPAPEDF